MLKDLIPGTQEYYYFHCLHFQNTQQYDRVDDLLAIYRHHDLEVRWFDQPVTDHGDSMLRKYGLTNEWLGRLRSIMPLDF